MLVIKKHGKDVSRKGSFDSGIGMQVLVVLRTRSFEDFFFLLLLFRKKETWRSLLYFTFFNSHNDISGCRHP